MSSRHGARRADELARELGSEVLGARATLGLTREHASRIARIAPGTFAAVEAGKATVQLDSLSSACHAVGLRIWVKAYPAQIPSLRDTGQLELVTAVVQRAHSSWRPAIELVVDTRYGRAADLVLFGPDEIIHQEFERRLLDWQNQYRSARVKQEILASSHQRPVRLVMVVEDSKKNRATLKPHLDIIKRELPAGSREVLQSLASGRPLGRDGLLWIRRSTGPRRTAV